MVVEANIDVERIEIANEDLINILALLASDQKQTGIGNSVALIGDGPVKMGMLRESAPDTDTEWLFDPSKFVTDNGEVPDTIEIWEQEVEVDIV